MGARNFMNAWNAEGPAHHCAIGVGQIASKLRKLAQLLGMECTVIE
jgi:L-arabinose isomerase